jgi:hypothetical protein
MNKFLIIFLIIILSAICGYSQKMDQPARWGTIQGDVTNQTDLIDTINNAGYLTNSVISSITTLTDTNPVFTVSESIKAWKWVPVLSNVTLRPTFTILSSGLTTMGKVYFANTNNNTVVWPTNVTEFVVNGLSQTNITTTRYMEFYPESWDGKLRIWIGITNTLVRP